MWYADPDLDIGDRSGAGGPRKLMFSLTGKCNLRCAHCARGIYEVAASETPATLVDYVIDQVLPTLRAVRLGGTDLGEQLASRHFDRFLTAVRGHPGLELELVTNLTIVSPARAQLIAAACSELAVSLEGTGEFFARTRGFPWEKFRDNLALVRDARRANPESRLEILALVTCYFDNLDELVPILDLAELGVDRFRFRPFHPNHESQSHQCLDVHRGAANRVFRELRRLAGERDLAVEVPNEFELPPLVSAHGRRAEPEPASPAAPEPAAPRWVCHFPFETASVFPDGQVSPCCETLFLGRLDPERPDLRELFQGEGWRELRRQVVEHDFRGRCVTCEFRLSRMNAPGA